MQNKPSLNNNFSTAMNYYKTLRKKNNKEISDALQLPATTISAWNTGRHLPDMNRLQKLATYLDAPIEQFFNFTLENIPDKDIQELHARIDTDGELVRFLKSFLKLSEENKHIITVLTLKIQD